MFAALALLAMLIELVIGYPDRVFRTIGHPVTWMGALIALLDRALNRQTAGSAPPVALARVARRINGIVAVFLLLGIVGSISFVLGDALFRIPYGIVAAALLGSTLLAQKSLHRHVAEVADALERDALPAARLAVAKIVGRDVANLDAAGVARAAIESLAENFSDGVVAPALWMSIGGLPVAALYKAINTADSMIGHRTPRYAAFGWAAARLDDLVNLPASRLSALCLVAAAAFNPEASAANAWRTMWRDAAKHRSPNAGYSEAAMAGALGLSLAGPRLYAGVRVDDDLMGDGRRDAKSSDIRAALALYRYADAHSAGDRRHRGRRHRHRANVMSRSRSTWASRCAASASSVCSID